MCPFMVNDFNVEFHILYNFATCCLHGTDIATVN